MRVTREPARVGRDAVDARQPHVSGAVAHAACPALAILADGLHSRDHLRVLRRDDLAGRRLAVRLRVPSGFAPIATVPNLRPAAAHGPVLRLRVYGEAARIMRLTQRCLDLFRLLQAALWLFTGQIHRRFFPNASLDAARKFLRKQVERRHLVAYREHRMMETLFALGPEGRRALQRIGVAEIRPQRRPPKQLAHLTGINDIRIAAELAGQLSFFFACWELPAFDWPHAIIPDAVCALSGRTFAIEYDRGMEGVRFFAETKIAQYERGLEGLPLTAILVITDGERRMRNLAQAVSASRQTILFSTLERVRARGLLAPVFMRHGEHEPVRLI
jgi:hypothetical protein